VAVFLLNNLYTDPTPAAEASQSLIASIKAKAESFSTVGKRLVSEKEWDMMQKEVCP